MTSHVGIFISAKVFPRQYQRKCKCLLVVSVDFSIFSTSFILEGTTLSDILCREAPPERGKFMQMLLVRLEVECMTGISAGI